MTPEQIAQVCHEANRVLQVINDEPLSPHWDDAPDWQRESALEGVHNALDGATPEQSHENWLRNRRDSGWTYGAVKDEQAKTHPCLVEYVELPPEQRIKDHLFTRIVQVLS